MRVNSFMSLFTIILPLGTDYAEFDVLMFICCSKELNFYWYVKNIFRNIQVASKKEGVESKSILKTKVKEDDKGEHFLSIFKKTTVVGSQNLAKGPKDNLLLWVFKYLMKSGYFYKFYYFLGVTTSFGMDRTRKLLKDEISYQTDPTHLWDLKELTRQEDVARNFVRGLQLVLLKEAFIKSSRMLLAINTLQEVCLVRFFYLISNILLPNLFLSV